MEKQGPQPQEGWALKTVKKPTRTVKKAKDYLVQKFDAGTKTGLKADPVQVSREMKYVKDNSGQLLFKPDEWRTAQQINSFFSRLSALQKRQKQLTAEGETDEIAEISEEDGDAWDSEMALERLRNAVFNDLLNPVPVHPIQVGERNTCQLARANKLHALEVSQLREICEELGLRGQGSEKRKKTFIGPLQTYVERCSCT